MIEKTYITKSVNKTQKLANDFAKKIKAGTFIAFYGDLGAGKTTFIQGFAKGLGIKRRIISPTFIIVRSYDLRPKTKELGSKIFYHIDLYRTFTKDDLLGLGIDQILEDENSIVAVEWSEKIGELLPKKRFEVWLKYIKHDEREITIKEYER